MSNKQYKILKQEKNDKNELIIEVELDSALLEKFNDASIKDFKLDLELPGFRKGQVPDNMVLKHFGEMTILENSAYKALNNIVPVIILDEKIDALTQPQINITKIAIGSPLEFKMIIALMPEIKLADYKKIAKEVKGIEKQEVTEKELNDYIDYIRRQRRDSIAMAQNKKIDDTLPLPELDDAFVKSLGKFESIEDFKNQLKENMLQEKDLKEMQRRRLEIIEKIISESDIKLPDALVEQEQERMIAKFRHDIENMKIKYEDYLSALKKSEEDLKKEWKVDAEKKVKMNLILPKIAEAENLKPKAEDIEHEVHHLKEHDPNIDEGHATIYVSNVLTNEEVFKFLENLK